jgi:cytochrome c biogenesis protein CcmG/thiol:disulfide interchange protein DsbE
MLLTKTPTRVRTRRLAIIAAGVVLLVAGAVGWMALLQPAQGSGTARPGSPAPQIALQVVGGGTSDLAAEKGKVVLVNFWATWCEPCKAEMPALQQLADELTDRPFILYSVDLQEDAPQIEAFQRQYNLRLYAVLDQDGDVTRAYGVRALPSTFLIDKTGVLRMQRLGPLLTGDANTTWSETWLAAQVRSLLETS